eukprot:1158595-Pelagomonas_calceolata.AAC.4
MRTTARCLTFSLSTCRTDQVPGRPSCGSPVRKPGGVPEVLQGYTWGCCSKPYKLRVESTRAGLEENPDRPHHKLPYRGAWLWIGPEMIHLMELPDPDPKDNRPEVSVRAFQQGGGGEAGGVTGGTLARMATP